MYSYHLHEKCHYDRTYETPILSQGLAGPSGLPGERGPVGEQVCTQ